MWRKLLNFVVMYELTEHIEYLVYQHDCVVIPGVGAIIAYHVPAYVDSERNCIFPPRRELTFNPQINHADGLLAASVARRENVSYDKATHMVDQSVSDMMSCLDSQREITIGRIGLLRKSAEGTLEFKATERNSLSLNLTGLSSLSLSVAEESAQIKVEQRSIGYSLARRFVNVAASIVLLVMLGFMLSTPVVDSNAVMASMTSFKFGHTEQPEALLSTDIDLNIAMPDSATATGIATEHVPMNVSAENDKLYYIIVASLPNESKAKEFIASAGNDSEEMHILNTGTRCRVYIDRVSTLQQALEAKAKNNRLDKYPDAWVFRN